MNVSQPAPNQPPYSVVAVRETPAAFHDPRYEAFVKANLDKITRQLTYLSGDPELAKEAALDGLIEMANHWSNVTDGTVCNPEHYAMRFAINKLRNGLRAYLRRTAREVELTVPHLSRVPVTTPIELPGWRVEFQDRLHLLRMVMPQFFRDRPAQAATVYLRYLREYEIPEVAQTLGTEVPTVRSNLRHGLSNLRQMIEDLEGAVGPGDEGGRTR